MQKFIKNLKSTAFFLLLAGLTVACKDDDMPVVQQNPGADADNPNSKVNSWITGMMEELYYWTEELPENPDQTQQPEDYFKSLLNSQDRFSVLVPDYQALINSLNGVSMEAGYEFSLAMAEGSDSEVVAVILYVKENSPASQAGLKRGDVVMAVNGTTMNLTNYRSLLKSFKEAHTLTFRRYDEKLKDYETRPEVSLQVTQLAENPHFLDTVYTIGSNKIGYLVYQFFSPGPGEGEYDLEMDQIFEDFKSLGVTDFVLDLRYNGGGAISSARNLGSLIGPGVDKTKVFYENRWNPSYQEYWESQPEGEDILRGKFKDKAANIGNNLSGKVYVLTGNGTASASELIINGLKPYMEVFLIGEQTYGKNVGSIPVEDKENPENKYGILPIVFQVFNSQGSSDYSTGFVPDAEVDEFKYLPLKQLGDVEEPLLARAIAEITGVNARTKTDENARISVTRKLESSLDSKAGAHRLIYDLPINLNPEN